MHSLTVFFFIFVCFTLSGVHGVVPSSNTPERNQPKDKRIGKNFEYYQQPPPLRSYVIYDEGINYRDRPLISSRPSWHAEFNQRQQQPVETQSVYSNLIQIYDNPQRIYYGPHDGKAYLDHQNYPKPSDVPKYEVIYPYDSQRTQSHDRKLPERFPIPFSPNKYFEIIDQPPRDYSQKNYGIYRTETVRYDDSDKRANRAELCNYIRLNDKGFPLGNEMCGRSISDIILESDYSTTGDLVLEHRKRYRGVNQRQKRAADSGPRCCGDAAGSGYGYYRGPDFGYDTRPYYHDNQDEYGQETSNNRGLTSYLANRGRGSDEDDESTEDESSKTHGHDRGQSGGRKQFQNRNPNRNQSSVNRPRNSRRNYGTDDDSSSTYDRNGGNNYGYMRSDEPNRHYGSRYDGFRNVGGGSFGYAPYGRYKK